MKPKINLRLCVAGAEELIPKFEKCLNSYLKYFDIGELLVYTTNNLLNKVAEITTGKADKISIYYVDSFYEQLNISQNIRTILDYSKGKKFKANDSMFYLRMRIVMDYYLAVGKPFILSDIDIEIHENIQPIVDWIETSNSPEGYILYAADYYDDYYQHSKIIRYSFGDEFFEQLPKFNNGWMCVPKGVTIDIEQAFDVLSMDMNNCPAEMAAIAVAIIKNKIKTKLLPRELMVTDPRDYQGKTLAHLGPYGL